MSEFSKFTRISASTMAIGLASIAIGHHDVHNYESEQLAFAQLSARQQYVTTPPFENFPSGEDETLAGLILACVGSVGLAGRLIVKTLKE
ncbi:MAG: hypothetical protein WA843_00930 [Candidatus Saccharimonadales bacterium]